MDCKEEILFTKRMRNATREIHSVSDALINAKIGFAMTADRVWAEGLLVFYEVFQFLEGALDRYSHTLVGEMDIAGIRRKEAFEKDLTYYLGPDWKKGYAPRESVCQYLKHLEKLEAENPYFLLAYVYHLYMGLLSGGQILRRKRALLQKLKFSRKESLEGLAVVEVEGSVAKIKKEMTDAMNQIAEAVDEEVRQRLLEESKMVFVLNNNMVNSIEGAGAVVTFKVIKFGICGALVIMLFTYIRKLWTG